jgi:hypothetical protein
MVIPAPLEHGTCTFLVDTSSSNMLINKKAWNTLSQAQQVFMMSVPATMSSLRMTKTFGNKAPS